MHLELLVILCLIWLRLRAVQTVGRERGSALFAQVQFVDQFFITIGFCFAQIIEQTPAMRDHLKQAASRRVILPVDLKVFG